MQDDTSQVIYTDLRSLVERYKMNDLPVDQLAFPYRDGGVNVKWVHRDELKRMVDLEFAYPSANNKRGA